MATNTHIQKVIPIIAALAFPTLAQAGQPESVMAPAPQSDCDQGWTLGLEVLGLKPYQSDGIYDGDLDAGYRGSLGYQFNDCLFTRASGFGFETDADVSDSSLLGSGIGLIGGFVGDGGVDIDDLNLDLTLGYADVVIGQTFGQSDKMTLSPYAGLCWAKFDEEISYDDGGNSLSAESEYSGIGIVIGIDATRSLGNNFSLYGKAKQSVLFGESDLSASINVANVDEDDFGGESDDVAFISEFGLGVQYDFAFSNVAANVRLGVEGQWWSGVSSIDSADLGLGGFVLGANFRF